MPRKKKEDGPKYDEGPFVIRGHLIMGALTDQKVKVAPIRTETRKVRAIIASFDPKVNPNWEANIAFAAKAMNRAAGYGRRQVEEADVETDEAETEGAETEDD
jgi:hypothetical protein